LKKPKPWPGPPKPSEDALLPDTLAELPCPNAASNGSTRAVTFGGADFGRLFPWEVPMSTARFHLRLSLCLLFAALLISASAGQGQATISIIWAGAERERVSAFAPLPQPQTSPELWSKAAGREKPHDDLCGLLRWGERKKS